MKYRLIQITAPHFCAGIVVNKNCVIIQAAPILRWTNGKHIKNIMNYCKDKKWRYRLV